ncbi:MAG: hypothetical protein NE328_07545 [Lentisphaeraceae bacterium]|nr:hypothetical protein [Lentisphaeraceae bacterium]
MYSVLKENYEKVLLALMLLLLAVASIMCILTAKTESMPVIIGGGQVVDEEKIPIQDLKRSAMLMLSDSKNLEGFLYCRNSSCNYLIHKSLVKCNWCDTPVIATEVFDNDMNKNKIEDKLELQWGLKLDDPNELLRDKDGDGFSTIDEYGRDYSPIDSSSHPPLALRATFVEIKNKYIPFKIKDVVISEDIRGKRRVYVDGVHSKRGSFYLSVGEETDWLAIVNAGETDGRKYAELKYFDFTFKIFVGEKLQYPTWPKYIIRNGIRKVDVAISMGEHFELQSKSGSIEKYKLIKRNKERNELHISNEELSKEFIISQQQTLKEPLE